MELEILDRLNKKVTPIQLHNLIKKEKGSVEKTEYCGLRQLAYPIKKNTKGHYVLLNLKTPPTAIKELERVIRLSEDVIRYMTVCVNAHETGQSILMTQTRQGPDKYPDKKKFYDRELRTDESDKDDTQE